VADGSIDANKLVPNAVTTGKIADGAVTTAKIATGAVSVSKLSGMSGSVSVDPGTVDPQSCVTRAVDVTGMVIGDHPVLQSPADLEDGLTAQALAADTPDKMNVRICNVTVDPVPAVPHAHGYLVLR
jgi:hypothetical protein